MIAILLLLIVVPLLVSFFKAPLFEISVALLLTLPIEVYLIGNFSFISCLSFLILNVSVLFYFFERRTVKPTLSEFFCNIAWIVVFLICAAFCYRWTDFMPMGERLRDYALLSSVVQYPSEAREPWMAGANLNYYIYWYRFGAVLNRLGGIPIWDLYHLLQSVTFSLYIACAIRILMVIGNFKSMSALFAGIMIGFGSNIEGVIDYWKGDDNWWGPSRVIKGAINEFPAWSFLLGDLHPHYVSLSVIPFLILCAFHLRNNLIPFFFVSVIFAPVWIYNCNAWEVPLWLIFFSSVVGIGALGYSNKKFQLQFTVNNKVFAFLGILFLLSLSLFLSARNISSGGDSFTLVRNPILLTTVEEMFLHFGFPLAILAVVTVAGLPLETAILAAGTLLLSLLFQPVGVFLMLLFVWHVVRARTYLESDGFSISGMILEALPLAGLIIIIIPEVVFLNDPYGGESERMNTIFKAYTTAWGILHLSAFCTLKRVWNSFEFSQKAEAFPGFIPVVLLYPIFLGFFIRISDVRASNDFHIVPVSEGLSKLDTEFPGAAEAIRALRAAPAGTVLEAQDNPYSLTTHVSTLASKEAYLGWANHINLLVRDYGEVSRREKVTEAVYKSQSCHEVQAQAVKEKITYIVRGPLELKKYGEAQGDLDSCLKKVVKTKSYVIYTIN